MAVLFRWYDRATLYTGDGTYNAGSPQVSIAAQPINVCLIASGYTFSAAHVTYADLTNELAAGNGYSLGGVAIGSLVFSQSTAVSILTGANPTWNASGSGIPAFRYAVAYINATRNGVVKPLLFAVDNNGVDVPATTSPNPLAVTWSGSGIYQIQHS